MDSCVTAAFNIAGLRSEVASRESGLTYQGSQDKALQLGAEVKTPKPKPPTPILRYVSVPAVPS